MSQLAYDSRTGNYVGTTADGRHIVVDSDEWSEAVNARARDEGRERDAALESEMLDMSLWSTGEWDAPSETQDSPTILPAPSDETTPESAEGIERRYFAGLHSLLDRADLRLVLRRDRSDYRIVAADGYKDFDTIVQIEIGEEPTGSTTRQGFFGRWAWASVTSGFHVTGGGCVTTKPDYLEPNGEMAVWSATEQGELSRFALRSRDAQRIWERALPALALQLFGFSQEWVPAEQMQ